MLNDTECVIYLRGLDETLDYSKYKQVGKIADRFAVLAQFKAEHEAALDALPGLRRAE